MTTDAQQVRTAEGEHAMTAEDYYFVSDSHKQLMHDAASRFAPQVPPNQTAEEMALYRAKYAKEEAAHARAAVAQAQGRLDMAEQAVADAGVEAQIARKVRAMRENAAARAKYAKEQVDYTYAETPQEQIGAASINLEDFLAMQDRVTAAEAALATARQEARREALEARQDAVGEWAKAWDLARDSILNQRSYCEEGVLNGEQINAVLSIMDENDPRPSASANFSESQDSSTAPAKDWVIGTSNKVFVEERNPRIVQPPPAKEEA